MPPGTTRQPGSGQTRSGLVIDGLGQPTLGGPVLPGEAPAQRRLLPGHRRVASGQGVSPERSLSDHGGGFEDGCHDPHCIMVG
jgi:hypothetical protein